MSPYGLIRRVAIPTVALAVVLAGGLPARAQAPAADPISGTATVLRIRNQYAVLVYGQDGTPAVVVPAAPDTDFEGRWGLATTGGDPNSALDDDRQVFAWNFLSLQVEPQITGQETQWYRLGDSGEGQYTIGPIADQVTQMITSTWETTGDIQVPVSSGGSSGSSTTVDQPVGIQVQETLALLRDTVRVEYVIKNTTGFTRRVRARIFIDPIEDAAWITGRQQNDFETDFPGGKVPDEWRLYSPLSTPEMVVRGILSKFGATRPNRYVIGSTGPLCSLALWDYVINPTIRLYGVPDPATDACESFYETFNLQPGQTRSIVTYAGLGIADEDPTPPYVLAGQAPRSLGFVLGDDPNTSEQEPSYASPQSFTIQGFMYNSAEFDITNARMYLTLPPGLHLASGESPTQTIGAILRGQEGAASWRVEVEPGVSGIVSYTITSSGVPVNSKTVTGTIEVPAQAKRTFKPGLVMMSLPFQFSNPDTAQALGLAPDRIRLARWDPQSQKYAFYPDSFVSQVGPGAGFWFRPDLTTTLTLRGAAPVARSLSANFVLPVKPGWNMIGAPYVYAVPWANTRVSDGQQVLSLDDAARAGWLRPTLFSYNPNLSPAGYEFSAIADASLEPWTGYWLRADRECFLVIPKVTAPYASIVAPDQRSEKTGWRIQLTARTRTASDLFNFAGASRATPDGYDLQDIDEPPAPGQGYVSLRFVHTDWGRNNGYYTQDIREEDFAIEKTWNLEVNTDQVGDTVTLGWPTLNARLPKDMTATLVDLATGKRVSIRTAGHYAFQATEDPRQLQLIIARRDRNRLIISDLQVNPVRGRSGARSVDFQLSGEAAVDVRILAPDGKLIREVASRAPAVRGRNTLVWDGANNRGARLMSGVVLVEVVAADPGGSTVRVIRPCVLVR